MMTLDSTCQKIERYLRKDNVNPLLVDVQNCADLSALKTQFNIPGNYFIDASDYCNNDEFPRMDNLIDVLQHKEANLFLTGFTTFMKLKGGRELTTELENLLSMTTKGHVIVFCYQCRNYLNAIIDSDKRVATRVAMVDGTETLQPKLFFVDRSLKMTSSIHEVIGLQKIANEIENCSKDRIFIQTTKHSNQFPLSLFMIEDIDDAFDALCYRDPATKSLNKEYGTPKQWGMVQENFTSWSSLFSNTFGNVDALDLAITQYKLFDERMRWQYYIALKLYGCKNNHYLNEVAKVCKEYKDFVKCIYRNILTKNHTDSEFSRAYQERKNILNAIGNPISEVADFCKIVRSKEKDAIYYLTDNTDQEKELIFNLLDKYGEDYDRDKIVDILNNCYPDLALYLGKYRFKSDFLTSYFQDYKYQKVINKILPAFDDTVKDQAVKRDYITLLPARSSVIESIDKTDAQTYFTDAMGVEYLAFIMAICQKKDLMAKVTVAHCELPSITSRNKDFWSYFSTEKHPIITVSGIDEIKHHGKDDCDYNKTKLPIHLISELEIIERLLEKIRANLVGEKYSKAILIADHGASRLAVIHETENVWEMAEKGEHSGRCCPKSEIDKQPEYAVDADDFWALANYDRFRGSRKANVEVHGGASLEEVTIPIIEITNISEDIEVKLLPIDKPATFVGTPVITVSYRKKAAIKICINQKMQDVSIDVDGHTYDAEPIDENYYQVSEMPEIKKAKVYSVNVYACGNPIASSLPLIVKKEGGGERNLL